MILVILAIFAINADVYAMGAKVKETYQPNWESLKTAPIPEWLKDSKFGIYTHWGVYSVPAYGSNIYGADMYTPDGVKGKFGTRAYHEKTYGSIYEFGYKDFVPMFTAPKFDAAEWVRVMEDSGAKFGGICLVHHDGFCLWDSEYTRWDSKDMGPKRDIFGEIAKEIRKTDLKLLATFHHARTYGHIFGNAKKGNGFTAEQRAKLDIYDPQYDDFYRNPDTVTKEEFSDEWHNKIDEVIRKYQPDLIWFDGLSSSLKQGVISEEKLLKTISNYYNAGNEHVDHVSICNKLPSSRLWNFPLGFGLRCYENGRDMEEDVRGYWLIDRAIGYPWTWVNDKTYKDDYDYHVRSLVDLVSRGGVFLLSLTPKGDGSIPEREKEIMAGMGRWMRINSEGIHGTRTWKTVGEGYPASMIRSEFPDPKRPGEIKAAWNYNLLDKSKGEAIRFTRKGNTLFAYVIGEPKNGKVLIKTLAKGNVEADGKGIKSVSMLGTDENIQWQQTAKGLSLKFPKKLPGEIAYGFKIEVNGTLDDSPREQMDDNVKRVGDFPAFKSKR
jgi:alpha-L-fucosidase